MRNNRYSRQQNIEARQNIRSAVIYTILTIASIFAILFFGIPLMGKIAGFFHDLRTSGTPVEQEDNLPPASPAFETLPEFTNKVAIDVLGTAESGATVKLTANGKNEEILVNNEGRFSYRWELNKGENKIFAKAVDSSGNESQNSETFKVVFDDQAPKLEILSPNDGASFGGSRNRQIKITGITEKRSSVNINERIVAVDTDGNYSFFTTLIDGENKFNIKAIDQAGNETVRELTLFFTP